MAMKIQTVVFWIRKLLNDVIGYQCFGGPGCLYLQGKLNVAGKGGINTSREYKRG
jgi:hypothetical protein